MAERELVKQTLMRMNNNMDIFWLNLNCFSILPRRDTWTFTVLHMLFLLRDSYIKV